MFSGVKNYGLVCKFKSGWSDFDFVKSDFEFGKLEFDFAMSKFDFEEAD